MPERSRDKSRKASSSASGIRTSVTDPTASISAKTRASRLSFFTRSPGARSSFEDAATTQLTPAARR